MPEAVTGRSDARANRQKLMAAARELFAERGVQTEMKDIADRAGVGVGTLYRNFATKDDLVSALIAEVVSGFAEAFELAEREPDARKGMLALLRFGWTLAEEHGALMEALFAAGHDKHEAADGLHENVLRILQRGAEQGTFRSDVPPDFMMNFLDRTMPFVYLDMRKEWGADLTARYSERMLLSALTGGDWPDDSSA
jgi:AcrR family transcriptional regulator